MLRLTLPILQYRFALAESVDEYKELSGGDNRCTDDCRFILENRDDDGYGQIVMFLGTSPNINDPDIAQALVHESIHSAMCILHHLDIRFDYNNQETLCYLGDYIFNEVSKHLQTQKAVEPRKTY